MISKFVHIVVEDLRQSLSNRDEQLSFGGLVGISKLKDGIDCLLFVLLSIGFSEPSNVTSNLVDCGLVNVNAERHSEGEDKSDDCELH